MGSETNVSWAEAELQKLNDETDARYMRVTDAQFEKKLAKELERGGPLRFPPGLPEAEKARYEAERASLQATRDRQLRASALLEEPERGYMFVGAQEDYTEGVAELMFDGLDPLPEGASGLTA